MDIVNSYNLFYQVPIAAILSVFAVYKFSKDNPIENGLAAPILRGMGIGVATSIIIPIFASINTLANHEYDFVEKLIKDNLTMHVFMFILFIMIGILCGISIVVYLYNEQIKAKKKQC